MATCERCGKHAGFRTSEPGVEHWVCENCLELKLGALGLAEIASAMVRAPRTQGDCPNCGTTALAAIESGLVGCPLCYEALEAGVWKTFDIARSQWSRMDVW